MENKTHFTEINDSNKIWAIGSIHSRLNSFISIEKYLLKNFQKDDYLIFLGNVIGLGKESTKTLNSVIELRNKLMANFLIQVGIF